MDVEVIESSFLLDWGCKEEVSGALIIQEEYFVCIFPGFRAKKRKRVV